MVAAVKVVVVARVMVAGVRAVQPGVGTLQAALNAASAGDELVLADGTYTGSGTTQSGANMLHINKAITVRALNFGQAVLNGQN